MVSLLIDFNNIIHSNKHSLLLKKIKPIPQTKFLLGLILLIPPEQLVKLDSLKLGEEKINYLNDSIFIKKILDFSFIICNKNFCELYNPPKKYLSTFIDTIEDNFEQITEILVSIDISERKLIEYYSKNYFSKPYICSKNFCNRKKYKDNKICLLREKNNLQIQSNNIIYTLEQLNKPNYCTISAKLSSTTISKLNKLCTYKEKGIEQKEKAGILVARKVKNDQVHIVEMNEKSLINGTVDGVDIVPGLYNFHSHPIDAYKKYNVKLGWPSGQDYIGFLLSVIEDNTIFHLVITLEGIYIISLSKFWCTMKDKLTSKIGIFIEKNYDFCYKKGDSIQWYLDKVNNIKYKANQLFLVQYLPWKQANDIFTLPYAKVDNNCFTCSKTKEIYEQIYI